MGNVTLAGRPISYDTASGIGPGPAKYTIEGSLDKYGLAHKIANVPIPKDSPPSPSQMLKSRRNGDLAATSSSAAAADLHTITEEEVSVHKLARVASAPN